MLGTESDGMIPRLYVDAPLAAGAAIALDRRAAITCAMCCGGRRAPRSCCSTAATANGWPRSRRSPRAARGSPSSARPRPSAGPDLWLVFAPLKRERIDLLAEKATELGCRRLQPIFTQHTAVSRVNVERLRRPCHRGGGADRAARPAGGGRAPAPERAPRELAGGRGASSSAPRPARAAPIAEALAGLPRRRLEAPYAVMTGPEGGFASSELDHLRKLPFVTPVGLGPRVLRADTAAIAALACWQALLGDGRERPPAR